MRRAATVSLGSPKRICRRQSSKRKRQYLHQEQWSQQSRQRIEHHPNRSRLRAKNFYRWHQRGNARRRVSRTDRRDRSTRHNHLLARVQERDQLLSPHPLAYGAADVDLVTRRLKKADCEADFFFMSAYDWGQNLSLEMALRWHAECICLSPVECRCGKRPLTRNALKMSRHFWRFLQPDLSRAEERFFASFFCPF
jgi:hypothetical protein